MHNLVSVCCLILERVGFQNTADRIASDGSSMTPRLESGPEIKIQKMEIPNQKYQSDGS